MINAATIRRIIYGISSGLLLMLSFTLGGMMLMFNLMIQIMKEGFEGAGQQAPSEFFDQGAWLLLALTLGFLISGITLLIITIRYNTLLKKTKKARWHVIAAAAVFGIGIIISVLEFGMSPSLFLLLPVVSFGLLLHDAFCLSKRSTRLDELYEK